jgi:hypothetical protein
MEEKDLTSENPFEQEVLKLKYDIYLDMMAKNLDSHVLKEMLPKFEIIEHYEMAEAIKRVLNELENVA